MKNLEEMGDTLYIFGPLFVIANKLDTLMDRDLKEFGVTSKQWFLSVILDTFFHEPPTLMDAARMMGSSYQNVKQIALKLEEKGLLRLDKDKKDGRVVRLVVTDQSPEFWKQTESKGALFLKSVFNNLDQTSLGQVREFLKQTLINLSLLEETQEILVTEKFQQSSDSEEGEIL